MQLSYKPVPKASIFAFAKRQLLTNTVYLKSFLLTFCIIYLFAQNTIAQGKKQKEKPTEEQKAKAIADRWKQELLLSETETQAFYEAKLAQITQKRELFAQKKGDKQAIRNEIKAINQTYKAKLEASLTPEHFQLWQEKRKAAAQKMKENRKEKKNKKPKENNTQAPTESEIYDADEEGLE